MPKILPASPQPAPAAAPAAPPKEKPLPKEVVGRQRPTGGATGKKDRPIKFPEIMVNGVVIPRKNLRITVANAKAMLQYETEAEYAVRMVKLQGGQLDMYVMRPPGMSTEHKEWMRLQKAPEAHFVDPAGDRVMCWRNGNNRPLRENWVCELMQDAAERGWRLNCENIIISKTGLVESGQHRLIMLIWLWICWSGNAKGDQWKEMHRLSRRHWGDEEPYIESLVACGAEEDQATLMTLDNTLARNDADNAIQMELFDGWTRSVPSRDASGAKVWVDAPLGSNQKKEAAKYLDAATVLLWERTGATGTVKRAKTKKATADFWNTHPTLLDCVRHIWLENGGGPDRGKAISASKLSPGECAAMLYLMGSSATNGATYRDKPSAADRDEDCVDWSNLDKAKQFFTKLAASHPDYEGSDADKALFAPFRRAIGMIADPNTGMGGTSEEKQALIAKAWAAYFAHGHIQESDLSLRYDRDVDQDGNVLSKWLAECPRFGGIDVGVSVKGKTPTTAERPPTREEVEAERAAMARRRSEADQHRAAAAQANQQVATPSASEQLRQTLERLKTENPGKLLIIQPPSGYPLRAYGTDAMVLGQTGGVEVAGDSITVTATEGPGFLARVIAAHPNAVFVRRELRGQPPTPVYTLTPVADAAPPAAVAATA